MYSKYLPKVPKFMPAKENAGRGEWRPKRQRDITSYLPLNYVPNIKDACHNSKVSIDLRYLLRYLSTYLAVLYGGLPKKNGLPQAIIVGNYCLPSPQLRQRQNIFVAALHWQFRSRNILLPTLYLFYIFGQVYSVYAGQEQTEARYRVRTPAIYVQL